MQNITKIVLTGGPCAGKSTALSRIEQVYGGMGYKVVFISETATELILGGITPWSMPGVEFQTALLSLQRFREKTYENAVCNMADEKVLIVCDRGALDNKAYMSADEFAEVMKTLNTNEIELRDNYDAVFHLVTAADGAVEFYTDANNKARTETPEQAIALDRTLLDAWTGMAFPQVRVGFGYSGATCTGC